MPAWPCCGRCGTTPAAPISLCDATVSDGPASALATARPSTSQAGLGVAPSAACVNSLGGFGHRQAGSPAAREVALTSDWPDSELIAGSRTEPAMFSAIFDRYHGELYRYLRRRV